MTILHQEHTKNENSEEYSDEDGFLNYRKTTYKARYYVPAVFVLTEANREHRSSFHNYLRPKNWILNADKS